jgi:hypothetical protein
VYHDTHVAHRLPCGYCLLSLPKPVNVHLVTFAYGKRSAQVLAASMSIGPDMKTH